MTTSSAGGRAVACRIAHAPWELAAYHALRRAIFCDEQRVFEHDDRDAWDPLAVPIVAVTGDDGGLGAAARDRVIGVVRIYESSPGVWYGGRLGVDAAFRTLGHVGRALIVKAVTTAHAWKCREFFATVQPQNVPFFRRLHWRVVASIEAHGRPHTLMQADLAHYPPSIDADVALRPAGSCHDAA